MQKQNKSNSRRSIKKFLGVQKIKHVTLNDVNRKEGVKKTLFYHLYCRNRIKDEKKNLLRIRLDHLLIKSTKAMDGRIK